MQLSSRHDRGSVHIKTERMCVVECGKKAYKRLLEREKDISINILAKVNIKKRNGNVGIMQA